LKIGLLGGTFDPVHNGHLALGEAARERVPLDRVVFVPAGQPWLKLRQALPVSSPEDRLAMVRLAIAGKPYFELSRREIERTGPTYTVDTIEEFQKDPGNYGDDFYFIAGGDSLDKLPQWHRVERLVRICHIVAVPRAGHPPPDLEGLAREVPGFRESLIRVDISIPDISATDIRRRIAEGKFYEHLVPPAVASYIREHHLYLKEKS
jgi:nicotinate-nucleotide adenylyltransferase